MMHNLLGFREFCRKPPQQKLAFRPRLSNARHCAELSHSTLHDYYFRIREAHEADFQMTNANGGCVPHNSRSRHLIVCSRGECLVRRTAPQHGDRWTNGSFGPKTPPEFAGKLPVIFGSSVVDVLRAIMPMRPGVPLDTLENGSILETSAQFSR